MTRHSSGESNFKLAGWVWAVLIAVIAVSALIFGWGALFNQNTKNVSADQCAEGEYSLTVWADPENIENLDGLLADYNESSPVITDYCVTASSETRTDDAVNEALQGDHPLAGAWVPADKAKAMESLTASGVPLTGNTFPLIGEDQPILSFAASDRVEELASRSATDLIAFIAGQDDSQASVSLEELDDSAATKKPEDDAPQPNAGVLEPGSNVLFLLDTSQSMGETEGPGSRLDNVRGPLKEKMAQVGDAGGAVSLWNYSSQLNPGVTFPFRNNVDLLAGDNGTKSQEMIDILGTGGSAFTHQSVLAVYGNAVQVGPDAKGDGPTRIILITDGPNDDSVALSDAVGQLRNMNDTHPVRMDVVAIGPDADVGALTELAQATGGQVYVAQDSTVAGETLNQIF